MNKTIKGGVFVLAAACILGGLSMYTNCGSTQPLGDTASNDRSVNTTALGIENGPEICGDVLTTGVPYPQCMALVDLYNSTDGDNWTNSTNWGVAGTAVGDWAGVNVQNGDVTKLILFSNNLSGSIPESLGNLSYLESLRLSSNNLSGSIPESLSNLSSLEYLLLNNNNLSGSIPESFGNLSNLILLYLKANNLSGSIPESLGNLSNLQNLHLSNNNLSGSIPESLSNLTSLFSLRLNNNNLSGSIPESFGNLSELRYLFLNNNNLSGSIPESLGNLSYLKWLSLRENRLSGEVSNVQISSSLTGYLLLDRNCLQDLDSATIGYISDLEVESFSFYPQKTQEECRRRIKEAEPEVGTTFAAGKSGGGDDDGGKTPGIEYDQAGNRVHPENQFKNHVTPQEIERLMKEEEKKMEAEMEAQMKKEMEKIMKERK